VQAQHPDLGVARLHHQAQIVGGAGAMGLGFGAVHVGGHNLTVPSRARPGHPGDHRAEIIQ
jgi:hypothetical protein